MHSRGEQMRLELKYKNEDHIFDEAGETVHYLEYPMFRATGIVRHGLLTWLGGVSQGYDAPMNLRCDLGDV